MPKNHSKPALLTPERLAQLKAMPYADYLKTQEWIRRRIVHLQAVDYRCQLCNGNERLQIHHRTYERLGCERWSDLLVLCGECHALFHKHRRLTQTASIQPQSMVKCT
jgi:hypothetical protein